MINNLAKIGNLKTEAHSSVKSAKYFPIYIIDGKKMIFKPLSKTKPLTTPLFAYYNEISDLENIDLSKLILNNKSKGR